MLLFSLSTPSIRPINGEFEEIFLFFSMELRRIWLLERGSRYIPVWSALKIISFNNPHALYKILIFSSSEMLLQNYLICNLSLTILINPEFSRKNVNKEMIGKHVHVTKDILLTKIMDFSSNLSMNFLYSILSLSLVEEQSVNALQIFWFLPIIIWNLANKNPL